MSIIAEWGTYGIVHYRNEGRELATVECGSEAEYRQELEIASRWAEEQSGDMSVLGEVLGVNLGSPVGAVLADGSAAAI